MADREPTDPGTLTGTLSLLTHRLTDVERRYQELHDRVGGLINFRIATVGEDGRNGRLGRVIDDVDKLGEKMRKMGDHTNSRFESQGKRLTRQEMLGWKIVTAAGLGGFFAGLVAKFLPF